MKRLREVFGHQQAEEMQRMVWKVLLEEVKRLREVVRHCVENEHLLRERISELEEAAAQRGDRS